MARFYPCSFITSRIAGHYGRPQKRLSLPPLIDPFAIAADSFDFALPRFVFALTLVAFALLVGGSWIFVSQHHSARAALHNDPVVLDEYRVA